VCGYETWSLILWVFENLVLTMVLGLRGWKVQEDGENFIMGKFIVNSIGRLTLSVEKSEIDGSCSMHMVNKWVQSFMWQFRS